MLLLLLLLLLLLRCCFCCCCCCCYCCCCYCCYAVVFVVVVAAIAKFLLVHEQPIHSFTFTKGQNPFQHPISCALGFPSFQAAVLSLAEFHGACLAHDRLEEEKLVERFPLLHPKHLMWFQVGEANKNMFGQSRVATSRFSWCIYFQRTTWSPSWKT